MNRPQRAVRRMYGVVVLKGVGRREDGGPETIELEHRVVRSLGEALELVEKALRSERIAAVKVYPLTGIFKDLFCEDIDYEDEACKEYPFYHASR